MGPELDFASVEELERAGFINEVTVYKNVTDEELRRLYSGALVLIFPSMEEGFGWPIVEAQACGCPVVTTDKEPMRETGGEAAIYAAEGKWTDAVEEVLTMSTERRADVVAAGLENARRYSATKMAREYVEVYRKMME